MRPLVAGLRQHLPECEFLAFSQTPDFDRVMAPDLPVQWILDRFDCLPWFHPRALVDAARRLTGGRSPSFECQSTLARADCVVATGGDIFGSDYGDIGIHLRPLDLAQRRGIATVLLAQSIGPFKTQREASRFVVTAAACDLITVREQRSYDYCITELKLDKRRVRLTGDPGFLLQTDLGAAGTLVGQCAPPGNRYITMSISRGISAYGKVQAAEHLAAWKVFIGHFRKLGYSIVLVPHVQRSVIAEDDRHLATEVCRSLGWPSDVRLVGANLSAGEMKGIIAGAHLNFAERMHAGIAGLSNAVPTGLIGYSVKSRGVLEGLFGYDNPSLPLLSVVDFLKPERQDAFARMLIERRDEMHARLSAVLPTVKRAAAENFELIAQMLAAKKSPQVSA